MYINDRLFKADDTLYMYMYLYTCTYKMYLYIQCILMTDSSKLMIHVHVHVPVYIFELVGTTNTCSYSVHYKVEGYVVHVHICMSCT